MGKFHEQLPLSDPANTKVLYALLEKSLRHSLESLYGSLNTSRLAVARAMLYISIAQSQSSASTLSASFR